MDGAARFQRIESTRLARMAGEIAGAAMRRFMGGTPAKPPRRRPTLNFNKPTVADSSAPPPEKLPRRPRAGSGVKTCSVCGAEGHQRNSPSHHPEATEAVSSVPAATHAVSATPPPPLLDPARQRPIRHCTVCGEVGHRSDNPRHREGAVSAAPSEVASVAAAAAEAPSEAEGVAVEPQEPQPADPSDDEAFVPEVVARARARHAATEGGRVRAKTIALDHLTRGEKRAAALVVYPDDVKRPRTREDCRSMPRPCPFVSCSHHLYLDVNPESGAIKLNFPHLEVWEMAETCSLDAADRGGITLEEVGAIMNLTRERIRQVEVRGLIRIRAHAPDLGGPGGPSAAIPSVEDRLGWR